MFRRAKDRAALRICGRIARPSGGERIEADRNRIFRPQAKFSARAIARQVKPAAEILSGSIQKYMRRLQEARLAACEPLAREMRKNGRKARSFAFS
jgi:hypothetical protein